MPCGLPSSTHDRVHQPSWGGRGGGTSPSLHRMCAELPMASTTPPRVTLAGTLGSAAHESREEDPCSILAHNQQQRRGSTQSTALLGQATTDFRGSLPAPSHSTTCRTYQPGLNSCSTTQCWHLNLPGATRAANALIFCKGCASTSSRRYHSGHQSDSRLAVFFSTANLCRGKEGRKPAIRTVEGLRGRKLEGQERLEGHRSLFFQSGACGIGCFLLASHASLFPFARGRAAATQESSDRRRPPQQKLLWI